MCESEAVCTCASTPHLQMTACNWIISESGIFLCVYMFSFSRSSGRKAARKIDEFIKHSLVNCVIFVDLTGMSAEINGIVCAFVCLFRYK